MQHLCFGRFAAQVEPEDVGPTCTQLALRRLQRRASGTCLGYGFKQVQQVDKICAQAQHGFARATGAVVEIAEQALQCGRVFGCLWRDRRATAGAEPIATVPIGDDVVDEAVGRVGG